MQNEIDRILGKPKRPIRNVFDIDAILPMSTPKEVHIPKQPGIQMPKKPGFKDYSGKLPPIIIENHYHNDNQGGMIPQIKPAKFMSAMESLDEDGMPISVMQPRPMTKQIKNKVSANIMNDLLGE